MFRRLSARLNLSAALFFEVIKVNIEVTGIEQLLPQVEVSGSETIQSSAMHIDHNDVKKT